MIMVYKGSTKGCYVSSTGCYGYSTFLYLWSKSKNLEHIRNISMNRKTTDNWYVLLQIATEHSGLCQVRSQIIPEVPHSPDPAWPITQSGKVWRGLEWYLNIVGVVGEVFYFALYNEDRYKLCRWDLTLYSMIGFQTDDVYDVCTYHL